MITSVRFPVPVAVVKGDMRVEWKPGDRGVRSIASYPHGMVAFVFDDGIHEVVCPPGTVIDTDDAASYMRGYATRVNAALAIASEVDKAASALRTDSAPRVEEPHEPASSEADSSPPPARPLPKSRRVRR